MFNFFNIYIKITNKRDFKFQKIFIIQNKKSIFTFLSILEIQIIEILKKNLLLIIELFYYKINKNIINNLIIIVIMINKLSNLN